MEGDFTSTQRYTAAFLVSIGAGLFTMFGPCILLIDRFRRKKDSFLGNSTSFAAGVMTFVSLCEILQVKSYENIEDSFPGISPKIRLLITYLFFFAGVVLCQALNIIANLIMKKFNPDVEITCCAEIKPTEKGNPKNKKSNEKINENNSEIIAKSAEISKNSQKRKTINDIENQIAAKVEKKDLNERDMKEILYMSINVMIAFTLHNFPEGFMTFITTVQNPGLGLVFGIGIAIHNIPEGLAIAIPIYYSGKGIKTAFLYVFISSIAEPIGGLIAYPFTLYNSTSKLFYGVTFGIISGIMMSVVIFEMIPIAIKFGKSKSIVAIYFFAGALLMALSLCAML